jgi:hypothetical protein
MKTVASKSLLGLLGYVSCLALLAGTATAQIGPIQPVLVLPDGKNELPHDRPELEDNYSVPVDVFVAANGSVSNVVVSQSTGNTIADGLGATYMRDRRFLPALDARGQPTEGLVRVNVSMFKRGAKRVVKVLVKPPALANETARVKNLMCADFIWEVERLRDAAHVRNPSFEVMPYTSAQMYVQQRVPSSELQERFWDLWPDALDKVISRCEKAPEKMFFSEVLVPSLDGAMPTRETATASASP